MTIPELNKKFGIPGLAKFDEGNGGMTRLVITSVHGDAHIYLYGGHVTHWHPRGHEPILFMSEKSLFTAGKAIRGGVPIIFPWFGARADNPKAPQHGFARSRVWDVESVSKGVDGGVVVVLLLKSDESTKAVWPHDFELRHRIAVRPLFSMELIVNNTGPEPFTFEEALHTYFTIGNARTVGVRGLEDTPFIDKVDGFKRKTEGHEAIHLTGETDRVYLKTKTTCIIDDPDLKRRILIDKSGSEATVVWNPWIEKAKAMSDFGPKEWMGMICVETANAADHAVTLKPGLSHTLKATLRVEAMRSA